MSDSHAKEGLDRLVICPSASIGEAIARLDEAGTGALVVCTSGRRLYGLLTDGDLRRALMRGDGRALGRSCGAIANRSPVVAFTPVMPTDALELMNRHDIDHLPVINTQRRLLEFLLRKDLLKVAEEADAAVQRLEGVIVSPDASISEACGRLDKAGIGAVLLCVSGRRLDGILTDGDIRRAVLQGVSLDSPCGEIASRPAFAVTDGVSSDEAASLMKTRDISHLPVVDDEGNVVKLHLRRDFSGEGTSPLSAVIMAGGYGKRLLPLTERVPKPMLPVGGRPLLELTIEKLRACGIRQMNLTTHYLPENIVEHFGDGTRFGVTLNYLKEDHPLGTAGGLKLMKRAEGPLLVINGDVLTGVPFQTMLAYHRRHGAEITVGVRKYEVQVPFGVVECSGSRIEALREKPTLTFFINSGMYILEPSAWDCIPEGQRYDMTELIQKLLDEGRTIVSFPVIEYWLDVGRHDDLQRAQEDVLNGRI